MPKNFFEKQYDIYNIIIADINSVKDYFFITETTGGNAYFNYFPSVETFDKNSLTSSLKESNLAVTVNYAAIAGVDGSKYTYLYEINNADNTSDFTMMHLSQSLNTVTTLFKYILTAGIPGTYSRVDYTIHTASQILTTTTKESALPMRKIDIAKGALPAIYVDAASEDYITIEQEASLDIISAGNAGCTILDIADKATINLIFTTTTNQTADYKADFGYTPKNKCLFYQRGTDLVILDQYNSDSAYVIKGYHPNKNMNIKIYETNLGKHFVVRALAMTKIADFSTSQNQFISDQNDRIKISSYPQEGYSKVSDYLYENTDFQPSYYAVKLEPKMTNMPFITNNIAHNIYDFDQDKSAPCILFTNKQNFLSAWGQLSAKFDNVTVAVRDNNTYWNFQTINIKK